MIISCIILGVGVGTILGLTGAGGGILAVPALVLGLGLSIPQAMPVSLLAIGLASLLGALDGHRKKIVRYKAATLMAAAGSASAPLGIWIASQVSATLLTVCFSMIMLVSAWRTFSSVMAGSGATNGGVSLRKPCLLNPETGRLRWTGGCAVALGGIGALAGLFTGMLGVGGGFVIVPLLRRFSNISMQGIVATSLMVITLVSASAIIHALSAGASIPYEGYYFIAAVTAGMVLSRMIAPYLRETWLRMVFGMMTVAVSLMLLVRI